MNPENEEQATSHILWQLMIQAQIKKKTALVTCSCDSNITHNPVKKHIVSLNLRGNTENVFQNK